jgi:hypothetical protein
MVKKLTPLNFLDILRALVIGEEQNDVQQAAKLKCITTGVPLNAPEGFVPEAHPLLHNAHDLPVWLDRATT